MTVKPGAFRFNTDSMKLEIFRGADVGIGTLAAGQWEEIQATSPDVQTGGTRGLRMGGNTMSNVIEYYNVESTGNTIDFGDLSDKQKRWFFCCIKDESSGCWRRRIPQSYS